MTQEEKQLLLKDLCSRLPYRVKVHITDETGAEIDDELTTSTISHLDRWIVKPYLRPMSSMTEKEKKDFNNLFDGTFQYFNQGVISDSRKWDKNEAVFVGELDCAKLIDWLISHHFDFRGLIPMGLALEAPNDMYKEK